MLIVSIWTRNMVGDCGMAGKYLCGGQWFHRKDRYSLLYISKFWFGWQWWTAGTACRNRRLAGRYAIPLQCFRWRCSSLGGEPRPVIDKKTLEWGVIREWIMPFYISEGFLFIIIFEQSFAIDKSKVQIPVDWCVHSRISGAPILK